MSVWRADTEDWINWGGGKEWTSSASAPPVPPLSSARLLDDLYWHWRLTRAPRSLRSLSLLTPHLHIHLLSFYLSVVSSSSPSSVCLFSAKIADDVDDQCPPETITIGFSGAGNGVEWVCPSSRFSSSAPRWCARLWSDLGAPLESSCRSSYFCSPFSLDS